MRGDLRARGPPGPASSRRPEGRGCRDPSLCGYVCDTFPSPVRTPRGHRCYPGEGRVPGERGVRGVQRGGGVMETWG